MHCNTFQGLQFNLEMLGGRKEKKNRNKGEEKEREEGETIKQDRCFPIAKVQLASGDLNHLVP